MVMCFIMDAFGFVSCIIITVSRIHYSFPMAISVLVMGSAAGVMCLLMGPDACVTFVRIAALLLCTKATEFHNCDLFTLLFD